MKKHLSLLFISLLLFSACGDDDEIDQLDFTYKNSATLIGKSISYIKSASPGTIMSQYCTDAKLYFFYDGSTTLGNLELYYNIESKKCDRIDIYSYSSTIDASYKLIAQADSELGTAYQYALIYTNSESTADTTYFNTLSEMQAYISSNAIEQANISYLIGYYPTDDHDYYVGGFTQESVYYALAEIVPASSSKKAKSLPEISNNIVEHIKSRISDK